MSNHYESQPLAWRFVLLLSGIAGLMFAFLTISGWIHGWEGSVALAILFAGALVVVARGLHRSVLHGFAAGFFSGLFAVELQAVFLPVYFSNNPGYELIEIPFGLPARLATAIFAPLPAMIAGLLMAGMVWALGKVWSWRNTGSKSQ